jgi:hypothetical protein
MPISSVRPASRELVRVVKGFHTHPDDPEQVVGRPGGWLIVSARFARQLAADGLVEVFDGSAKMLRHASRGNATGGVERFWRGHE